MNRKKQGIWKKTIVPIILIAAMIAISLRIVGYVQQSINAERKTYLSSQTETISNLISKTLQQYADYSESCAKLVSAELQSGEDIDVFLARIQDRLYMRNVRLILVDESCTWYGENGSDGRITATDKYEQDTADTLLYMTTGVDVSVEGLVFRTRLEEPVHVQTETGEATIGYCAVIRYMDDLQRELLDAFPFRCNSFMVDENGLMLYKNFALGRLIDGSNLFSKYERVVFRFGDSAEELLAQIRGGQTSVAEFTESGRHYFICTAPISMNHWYISFVIQSDTLAAGSYIRSLFLYVAMIGLLFALAVVYAGYAVIRIQNSKKQLETERIANAYLEKASQAKSNFLSNMSHDVRTPINGIIGMTMLAKAEANPPKTQDCLKKIEVSSQYLLSLVNDVLDISSIEDGKLRIAAQPTELQDFLEGCRVITEGQIRDRKVQLLCDFEDARELCVMADEVHLRQVLINILGNAVKFTPEGGTIRFDAKVLSRSEDSVMMQLSVTDTGVGIEPEFLNNIWDRFSQSTTGSRTEYHGTGVGMAISKDLVTLMGGTISVESELGKGSRFEVTLPMILAEKAEAPAAQAEKASIDGLRILIAEDNEINLEIITELLEDEGAVIEAAENGKDALAKFSASAPGAYDAILMDVMMPQMDGIAATKAIRALDRPDAGSIPIIAMSANFFEEDIRKTEAAGMNGHLSKPVDLNAVLQTISRLCRKEKA